MTSAIVEIFELMKYVNGGSRSFEEGCRISNSNHILLRGLRIVLQTLKMLTCLVLEIYFVD